MLQLLHNVSGAFQPGVLTALVGVSGAGKTTLLDVLAGRKSSALLIYFILMPAWLLIKIHGLERASIFMIVAGKTALLDVLAGRKSSALFVLSVSRAAWMLGFI